MAALVRTRVLPVRVSDTQWCAHTGSVFTCSALHCHWRAKLMPFNTASSSARLICWASFSGRSQQASSSTVSCLSNATPIAKELASTQTFSSRPSTHQSPWTGSSHCTESTISDIIRCGKLSFVLSSQPFVTELALLLSTPQATRSQPHTGKCPTSLLHKENSARRVTISGASGTMLPRFHRNLPCSVATANPNTRAPSSNRSVSLHSSPNLARCSLTRVAGIFVDIDVVNVCRCRVAHSLLLRQHRADNDFHGERSHLHNLLGTSTGVRLRTVYFRKQASILFIFCSSVTSFLHAAHTIYTACQKGSFILPPTHMQIHIAKSIYYHTSINSVTNLQTMQIF